MDTKSRLQKEKEELEKKLAEVNGRINGLKNLPRKLRNTMSGEILSQEHVFRVFPDHTHFLPIAGDGGGNFFLYVVITEHDERTKEAAKELAKRVVERYNDPYFD